MSSENCSERKERQANTGVGMKVTYRILLGCRRMSGKATYNYNFPKYKISAWPNSFNGIIGQKAQ